MLSDWYNTTIDDVSKYWDRIVDFTPRLIGAVLIIVVGLIIARLLKWAVITILEALKVQTFFDRIHFTEVMKKAGITFKVESVSADFIKWLTIVIFLIPSAKILGLDSISDLLERLLLFIPNVIITALIVLIGTLFANVLSQVVKAGSAGIGMTTSRMLAGITRWVIYVFIAFAAFFQLGIPTYLISVMFTGLIAALAIAIGLAFGLGGQNGASDLVKKIREDFKK
ncbi:MAG: hypothetical protein Q7S37_02595 [bacterium]|nr:hypothetical protein [bacterium]